LTEKVNKANSVLGATRRSFEYLDIPTFKQLYTALIRPHVEYAHPIWCPYKKKDIITVENMQKRATRMIPGLNNLSYEERLKKLNLPTLSYRRARGDMIEVYKLLNGKYYFDEKVLLKLSQESVTRGNNKKLYKTRPRLDIRKYSFSHRVVDIWNSLPNSVITARSVKSFEARLDKYWKNQEIVYNFEAKISTGRDKENEELESEAEGLLQEFI
jgi:ribonuclease P/MRP protein subunit RPP40